MVPDSERHGRPFNQFTLWFGTNLPITTVVTGALAVVFGSGAFWTILGLLIGNIFGGAVMALHSAQGPKLGLPQMISSRAPFGVYGAAVPLVLVLVVRLLVGEDVGTLLGPGGFDLPLLLLAISLAVSWQLAFGPYVADYSRYLPRATSYRTTFWWTFAGSVIGAQWAMAFGAVAAAAAGGAFTGGAFTGNEVSYVVGLGGAGAIAAVLYFVIAFGKLTVSVLDGYGGFADRFGSSETAIVF